MKKYIFLIFLCFNKNSFSQVKCETFPSSSELLLLLKNKPTNNINYSSFIKKCNVNDSINKRLIYLLDWRWTKIEVESYLENYFNLNKEYLKVESLAKNKSGENDSLFHKYYDSIKMSIKNEEYNEMSKYYYVDPSIIKTVGFIYLYDALPILKEALKDKQHYNTSVVELSLARLGDINLQKKIILECRYQNELQANEWIDYFQNRIVPKLAYISSQESIFKINEWLDTSKLYKPWIGRGEAPKAKASLIVVSFLKGLLQNKDFQILFKNFKYNIRAGYTNKDDELILKCKAWLIKNKGAYIYNKYFVGGDIQQLNFN